MRECSTALLYPMSCTVILYFCARLWFRLIGQISSICRSSMQKKLFTDIWSPKPPWLAKHHNYLRLLSLKQQPQQYTFLQLMQTKLYIYMQKQWKQTQHGCTLGRPAQCIVGFIICQKADDSLRFPWPLICFSSHLVITLHNKRTQDVMHLFIIKT